MYSILKKMRNAVQVVLAAPVKLPAKLVNIVKYVALALGVLETVVPDKRNTPTQDGEEGSGETTE